MTRSDSRLALASEATMIETPNRLRQKVGGRLGALDASAIAKAEEALKGLSGQFGQWLRDEVDKLEAARSSIRARGVTAASIDQLYLNSHDLKGLGGTYEYPLISRVASSLCKLMDGASPRTSAPLFLIDAHIDAIRAIVRDEIRDPDHPLGRALAQTLELRVSDHIAVAKASSTAP